MAILTGLGTSFVIATDEEALSGADVNKAVTPDQVMAVVSQGVSAVSGGLIYKGVYDATNLQPDLSNARQGDFYKVNVADTAYGKTFAVGDMLLINADMGGVIDNNKVDKIDNTESLAQLDDLSDVVITNATTGEVLRYDGANWVDAQLAYSDLSGTPTLGTAAALNVGTGASQVVQLDGSARLPAVDGSQLTNLPSGASALDDLSDVVITSASAGEVLRHNGVNFVDAQLAYSDLSGTPSLATVATTGAYSDLTGTPSLATVATTGAYSDLSGTPTLGTAAALNVGTSASQVVQLDGSARLPAVDGSQLTNLPSSGGGFNYDPISSTTTAQASYHYSCDTSGGAFTLNLPALSGVTAGQEIRVKLATAGNDLTIDASGTETIDGTQTYVLNVAKSAVTLVAGNGTDWEVI
jgi:hypothetical protein